MPDPTYIVGIDLGTTNSVVAYTQIDTLNTGEGTHPSGEIQVLDIPQLVDAGVLDARPLLPSFILVPVGHDVAREALVLPWDKDPSVAVGEFAKQRGAELPQRLIASAKSWLCHTAVDRNSPILPWESDTAESKMSPVEASAAILGHIREAWKHRIAAGDDALDLEHQEILLTVPASFDAVARELTVRAARMAGLDHVTLLEEPQAAFYAWIAASGEQWRETVAQGDLILVCDVGGGTTDFSLIHVDANQGRLELERVAVGEHLLVGGDNMDLALAHTVAAQLAGQGHKLDAWQMRGLWHNCRNAKERLLSDPEARSQEITLLGRGSALIGGTLKTALQRDQVESLLLNGFFPRCAATTQPQSQQQAGLQEAGLPYASDPAVTHHLAGFLSRNPRDVMPTAVLFNGGVMKAPVVRNRVLEVIDSWYPDNPSYALREIASPHFDLAVARGAVYYGLARKGRGVRIRYGLNKSYYVGVAASMPAVPGIPAPTKALSVAPFGTEEGSVIPLKERTFSLVVGQPVTFDLLAADRAGDAPGALVEDWQGELHFMAAVETVLDGEPGTVIPVTLEVRVTEVGTLEVWCLSKDDGHRWRLEFNVRET
jgi:molecular chaperone DnaK (HSP70)